MISLNQKERIEYLKNKRKTYEYVVFEIVEDTIDNYLERHSAKYSKDELRILVSAPREVWQHAARHFTEPSDIITDASPKQRKYRLYQMHDVSMQVLENFEAIKGTLIEKGKYQSRNTTGAVKGESFFYGVIRTVKKNKKNPNIERVSFAPGFIVGQYFYKVSKYTNGNQPQKIKIRNKNRHNIYRYHSLREMFLEYPDFKNREDLIEKLKDEFI